MVALYLQYRPGATPADVRRALRAAAVAKGFDSSSPAALLNAMASRLPGTTATSPPPASSTPAPAPAPVQQPFLFAAPSFCTTCPWCMFCK